MQALYGIIVVWFSSSMLGAFERNDPAAYQWYVSAFVWFMLFFYAVRWSTRHFNSDTDYIVASRLKKFLYERFLAMDNNQVESKGTGRVTAILWEGVGGRNSLLRFLARRLLREVMTVVFSLIFIATISWQFFGLAVIYILLLGAFMFWLNKKMHHLRKERKQLWIEENRHKLKIMMSKFEVLQSEKTQQELDEVGMFTEKKRLVQRQINNYNYPMYDLPGLGNSWIRLVVMLTIGMAVFSWSSSIEEFAALMGAIGYLSSMIFRVTDSHKFWQEKTVHVEKLYDFLEEINPIQWLNSWNDFVYKKGDIKIANLRFGYGDELIFDDFSLQLQWWKKTAFVGESWSGKSTLMKLIAGYLHGDEWEISIDQQPLSKTKLQSYYRNIGYLTQEPSVFDGTIIENLTYASFWPISSKAIQKAISLAKCNFINDFKDGLQTEIGERWIKLSWWQRQRLAIAKIFLKNPQIILLDEPTSALDSFSEEAITEAMHNLFAWRTVVIIAHRLQTVKQADDIIVFDKGKIVERGTHKELLKQKGQYAKMLELQSGF